MPRPQDRLIQDLTKLQPEEAYPEAIIICDLTLDEDTHTNGNTTQDDL